MLDPARMRPHIPERGDDELSVLAEIARRRRAQGAGRAPASTAADIDAVICAASNMQRAYPAMAIEIQQALGIDGFGFDMNVACSSATFGIKTGRQRGARRARRARVLMVNPEICSGHLNFRDRDSHFIFGDVGTAVVVESADTATSRATGATSSAPKLKTQFSNNIRNNFGFLNRGDGSRHRLARDKTVRPGGPQGVQGGGADGRRA